MSSSALLPAVQAEAQLTEMLQGAMHYVVNGIPAVRGHESIPRRAEQLLYQCSGDVESAITLAIHESELRWSDAARKVLLACIPFVGLAASTLDLLWSQLRLVATIASLYGHDVYASDVQYRILLCIVQGTVSYNGERSTVNLAAQQVSRVVVSNAVGLVAGSVVPVASLATSLVSLYGHDVAHAGGRARAHFAPHLAIDLQRLRVALYVYAAVQLIQPAVHVGKLLRALPPPASASLATTLALVGLLGYRCRRWLYERAHMVSPPASVVSFVYFLAVECLRILLAMRVGSAAHLSVLAMLSAREHDHVLAAYYAHQALCGSLTLVAQKAPDSVSPALKQAQISVQLALLIWPFTGLHLHAAEISRLGIVSSALALLSLNTAVQELRRTEVAVKALGSQRVVQGVLVVLGAMGRVVVSPSELLTWVEDAAPPPTLCVLLLAVRRLAIAIGLLHGALVRAATQRGSSGLCAARAGQSSASLAVVPLEDGGGGACGEAEWAAHAGDADVTPNWGSSAGEPCALPCGGGALVSTPTELLVLCLALSVAMNVIWHSSPALGRFRIFVLLGNENTKQAMTKIAEWVRRYEIAMQPVVSWGAWTSAALSRAWKVLPQRVRNLGGLRAAAAARQLAVAAPVGAHSAADAHLALRQPADASPAQAQAQALLRVQLGAAGQAGASPTAAAAERRSDGESRHRPAACSSSSPPLLSEMINGSASSGALLLSPSSSQQLRALSAGAGGVPFDAAAASASFSPQQPPLSPHILASLASTAYDYTCAPLLARSERVRAVDGAARLEMAAGAGRLGAYGRAFLASSPLARTAAAGADGARAPAAEAAADGCGTPADERRLSRPVVGAVALATTLVAAGAASGVLATSGAVVVGAAGVCGAAYGARTASLVLSRRLSLEARSCTRDQLLPHMPHAASLGGAAAAAAAAEEATRFEGDEQDGMRGTPVCASSAHGDDDVSSIADLAARASDCESAQRSAPGGGARRGVGVARTLSMGEATSGGADGQDGIPPGTPGACADAPAAQADSSSLEIATPARLHASAPAVAATPLPPCAAEAGAASSARVPAAARETPLVRLRLEAFALGGGGTAYVRATVCLAQPDAGTPPGASPPAPLLPAARILRLWSLLPSAADLRLSRANLWAVRTPSQPLGPDAPASRAASECEEEVQADGTEREDDARVPEGAPGSEGVFEAASSTPAEESA